MRRQSWSCSFSQFPHTHFPLHARRRPPPVPRPLPSPDPVQLPHHVCSAVSPPSTRFYARRPSPARWRPLRKQRVCCAQLLCHRSRNLVWPLGSGRKVRGPIQLPNHAASTLTPARRPGQLAAPRLWSLDQARSYGACDLCTSNTATDIEPSRRHHSQGPRDGRVHYRGHAETVVKTYAAHVRVDRPC